MDNIFGGMLFTFILLIFIVIGARLNQDIIVDNCNDYGKFKSNNEWYKCEKIEDIK